MSITYDSFLQQITSACVSRGKIMQVSYMEDRIIIYNMMYEGCFIHYNFLDSRWCCG